MDRKSLIADQVYDGLKKSLLVSGKGRRPDLPLELQSGKVTQKLLVQLYYLREEGSKPWSEVEDWLVKIFPAALPHRRRVRHLTESAITNFLKATDVDLFLAQDVDFDYISDSLSKYKITRATFASPPSSACDHKIDNKTVVDIDLARKDLNYPKALTLKWIYHLTGHSPTIKAIDKILTVYAKVRSNRSSKPEDFKLFCDAIFSIPTPISTPVSNATDVSFLPSNSEKKIPSKKCENCQTLKLSVTTMKQLLSDEQCKSKSLEEELSSLKAAAEKNRIKIKLLRHKLWRAENRISNEKAKLVSESKKRKLDLEIKDESIGNLQLEVQSKKLKLAAAKKEKNDLILINKSLEGQLYNHQFIHDVKIKTSENNTYSDNVRRTAILLQSEASVAAGNVKKVIEIVGKHIFDYTFTENLPCTQTCLNMNVEGLAISNFQATESVVNSNDVTIHLDGTSRDHKKVISHQLTIDDGSVLFLGYTPVATEDSNTILDVTVSLLKSICDCYSDATDGNVDEVFLEFIKKITSTMTDRASSMKCFDRKLEEFLKSKLGAEIKVTFLHCNAHFLLGLSSSCDKAFKEVEENIRIKTGEPIGRDKDPKFKRFVDSETATNRLIRTLCDILGPRGDQKSGYRVEWVEFCPGTLIPSFKSNRFNCYFQASAAIIHHLNKIKSFFNSGVLPIDINQKVQSVSQDIEDSNLVYCISALALVYVKISGPYWSLINSSVSYSDFHLFVKEMYSKFLQWSEDSSELLDPQFCGLFGPRFSLDNSEFSVSISNFIANEKTDTAVITDILQNICRECSNVISRQLGEFLTNDFSHVSQHCPLTNLIGESSFGDYDYDIRRRPNCSILKRTASHCIKRNKTASKYLDTKSPSFRKKLFVMARKKGRELFTEAKKRDADLSIQIKEKMLDNQQKKIEKEIGALVKHGDIVKKVDEVGGLCKSNVELEALLQKLNSEKRSKVFITEAIKNQIRYHKVINNAKQLTLQGTFHELLERLKDFLG